jgi:hypothetical protein
METEQNTPDAPAVGMPVDWRVRTHDPERAAFEAWKRQHGGHYLSRNNSPNSDLSGYQDTHTQGQWEAWQAARPKRAEVGALINIAAELAQRKPIRALDVLSERSGRTLGRRAMDDAIESAHDSLVRAAMRIVNAARAL